MVPRSHAAHGEICARLPHAREWADYVPVPQHDSALQAADKGGARMLRLPAGSLVVWDSRTVHCSAPALRGMDGVKRSDGDEPGTHTGAPTSGSEGLAASSAHWSAV